MATAGKQSKVFKVGDRVFCTEYGVSDGYLYQYTVTEVKPYGVYLSIPYADGSGYLSSLTPIKSCFLDEADARADMEAQRAKKIKSLQGQIKKLQEIQYKVKKVPGAPLAT